MLPNQTWEKFEASSPSKSAKRVAWQAVYDSKHRAALLLHDALGRL